MRSSSAHIFSPYVHDDGARQEQRHKERCEKPEVPFESNVDFVSYSEKDESLGDGHRNPYVLKDPTMVTVASALTVSVPVSLGA